MLALIGGLSHRLELEIRSPAVKILVVMAGSLAGLLVMIEPLVAAPAPAAQIDALPEVETVGTRSLKQPLARSDVKPRGKRHLDQPLARTDELSDERVSPRRRRPLQMIEQAVFHSAEQSVAEASSERAAEASAQPAARMVEQEPPLQSARPHASRAGGLLNQGDTHLASKQMASYPTAQFEARPLFLPIAKPVSAAPEEVIAQAAPAESVPLEDDFRPLSAGRTDIRTVEGEMPTDHAREQFGDDRPIIGGSPDDQRCLGMVYAWEASGLCHGPLYFEDVNLERYGYSFGILQPAVSFAHFFGTVPKLPYMVGVHPPHECIYTLGYYRPGNCVPYQKSRLPFCPMAAFLEAEAITAFILLIP